MMHIITESEVEQAALEILSELGYIAVGDWSEPLF